MLVSRGRSRGGGGVLGVGTSHIRHSLVVQPLLINILDPPLMRQNVNNDVSKDSPIKE